MQVAVIQMTSTSDEEANWQVAKALVEEAAGGGAQWVGTPENTNFLGPHDEKARRAEGLDGPTCARFSELASRLKIHLLLGSFNELSSVPDRCYNTSVLFDPKGRRLGIYRKMHLFDVDVSDEVRFKESETVLAGDKPVVVESEMGKLGLSICYDLRFPELYRRLAAEGAEFFTVPAAFTKTTGMDHWDVLLKARAIENQVFVLAPAQCGFHDDRGLRESYGHAVIIDPWGEILAQGGDEPCVVSAEIDRSRLKEVRLGMPVFEHRRL